MKKNALTTGFRVLFCLLCSLLLTLGGAAGAAAVPFSSGLPALQAQWARSKGPAEEGMRLEYSYFIPATQEPCPLVVLLGGAGEGTPSGKELEANDFAYWSSEEYQARVADAPGMYLLILKAPEPVYFDTCPLTPMFAAIRDFVEHHNVDRKRIYVGGWCIGATGAARLATNHPDFFAGMMLFSQRTLITEREAETLKNMKIWLFACRGDTYSPYGVYARPSWENLLEKTADRGLLRCTVCDTAPRAALLLNHLTWRLAEQDYAPGVLGDYTDLSTVDGNGRPVAAPTVIQFMTAYKPGEAPPTTAAAETTAAETTTAAATSAAPAAATAVSSATAAAAAAGENRTTATQAAPAAADRKEDEAPSPTLRRMLVAAAAALSAAGAGIAIYQLQRRKHK